MKKQQNQTEFYSPFAHIPGRYEWCRIHSPSHGSFDTFIVIETTTDKPVTVYVNDEKGKAFMEDRYPESRCIQVNRDQLRISSSEAEGTLTGIIHSSEGPVREGWMIFQYNPDTPAVESPYGGLEFQVWGSRWSCTGMDLERNAVVQGRLITQEEELLFEKEKAVVTAGSYGTIAGSKK